MRRRGHKTGIAGAGAANPVLAAAKLAGGFMAAPPVFAAAAKQVRDSSAQESTVVIMTNHKNEAHLVFSAPQELLAIQPGDDAHATRLAAWLRGLGKKTGAGGAIFLVMPNTPDALEVGKDLIRRGLITDVGTQDGAVTSLRDEGIHPVADVNLFGVRRGAVKEAWA